jgi:hypothetical protein
MNVIILASVAALNISQGKALSTAVIEVAIAIIAVELGYICGAIVRHLVLSRCSGTGNDGRK